MQYSKGYMCVKCKDDTLALDLTCPDWLHIINIMLFGFELNIFLELTDWSSILIMKVSTANIPIGIELHSVFQQIEPQDSWGTGVAVWETDESEWWH